MKRRWQLRKQRKKKAKRMKKVRVLHVYLHFELKKNVQVFRSLSTPLTLQLASESYHEYIKYICELHVCYR